MDVVREKENGLVSAQAEHSLSDFEAIIDLEIPGRGRVVQLKDYGP